MDFINLLTYKWKYYFLIKLLTQLDYLKNCSISVRRKKSVIVLLRYGAYLTDHSWLDINTKQHLTLR